MADIADTSGNTISTSTQTPLWYDQLSKQFGDTASSALTNVAGLANNWYDQPLVAGLTPEQLQMVSSAPNIAGQWEPEFEQAQGTMQGGIDQLKTASTYNPAELQKHLNPYLTGVLDEIARRGNQNLIKNVMPAINQTFTGSGLFGASRHANFLQDAIQRNQQEILGAQSTAGNQAYQNAAQDYYNWGQLGEQSGQAQVQAGTAQGNQAVQNQTQSWDDLMKMYGLQEQQRTNTQAGLDAAYKDWQTQLQTPFNLMGGLASSVPNYTNLYSGAKTQIIAQNPTQPSALSDFAAILYALNTSGGTTAAA